MVAYLLSSSLVAHGISYRARQFSKQNTYSYLLDERCSLSPSSRLLLRLLRSEQDSSSTLVLCSIKVWRRTCARRRICHCGLLSCRTTKKVSCVRRGAILAREAKGLGEVVRTESDGGRICSPLRRILRILSSAKICRHGLGECFRWPFGLLRRRLRQHHHQRRSQFRSCPCYLTSVQNC